jgi:hypothetical protein
MLTTEPSADRGPQRGSPAGVVDAPDARSNSSNKELAAGFETHKRNCVQQGSLTED